MTWVFVPRMHSKFHQPHPPQNQQPGSRCTGGRSFLVRAAVKPLEPFALPSADMVTALRKMGAFDPWCLSSSSAAARSNNVDCDRSGRSNRFRALTRRRLWLSWAVLVSRTIVLHPEG